MIEFGGVITLTLRDLGGHVSRVDPNRVPINGLGMPSLGGLMMIPSHLSVDNINAMRRSRFYELGKLTTSDQIHLQKRIQGFVVIPAIGEKAQESSCVGKY